MISNEEYSKLIQKLGREPNFAELNVIGAMWSEHISYKSSKRWFSLFKTTAPYIALGIGEGAGLIDIGDDLLIGLGLESHNHPSAIEPFQGAATGVGGIIRDIISQGCKPIALLDSIRFGNLTSDHSKNLFENVVRGISSYGNCVGIPTVGGEAEFDPVFENNCLVNAMCVGVVKKDKVVRSIASTPGHFFLLYGARTGRDGIHGVSFASKDLDDKSVSDRPAVQIGDPLMEKVLIDATLELVEKGLLSGLQDLGGGGLSCAISEMTEKGNTGALIRLEDVPLREYDMKPWEILISESQERMLAVVSPKNIAAVEEILKKYDLLTYSIIGEVTNNSHYIAFYNGEKIIDLPVDLIINGFPEPEREFSIPDYIQSKEEYTIPNQGNIKDEILKIFESPNVGSKEWIYEQYDQHVQTQTVIQAGADAAVLRLDNGKYIALTLDSNSFAVYCSPYNGTANVAAEAQRNIVAVGAKPYAIVDCLNFGNPEKPDSYWQFVESIKGLGRFSNDFKLPVIGGNVSLYNETVNKEGKRERINPTPTIGIIGVFDSPDDLLANNFVNQESKIIQIGKTGKELGGSEYLRYCFNCVMSDVPTYDEKREKKSIEAITQLNKQKLIESCHDISNGGFIVALGEMMFKNKIGAKINLENIPSDEGVETRHKLFSETSSRFIIEVSNEKLKQVINLLETIGVDYGVVGHTTKEPVLEIENLVSIDIEQLHSNWKNAIVKYME
ncbi:MAG: phosphoribosylformylglycinamidine synthase subunit PurL [Candidatus Heimdallarchaeaceae archaeon]